MAQRISHDQWLKDLNTALHALQAAPRAGDGHLVDVNSLAKFLEQNCFEGNPQYAAAVARMLRDLGLTHFKRVGLGTLRHYVTTDVTKVTDDMFEGSFDAMVDTADESEGVAQACDEALSGEGAEESMSDEELQELRELIANLRKRAAAAGDLSEKLYEAKKEIERLEEENAQLHRDLETLRRQAKPPVNAKLIAALKAELELGLPTD